MQKTSDVYERLYHYTTFEGLLGILNTRSLWATNYKFLNDTSELNLFLNEKLPEVFRETIYKKYKQFFDENPEKFEEFKSKTRKDLWDVCLFESQSLIRSFMSPLNEQIYICSLCGDNQDDFTNKNGLLSQWRAYGKNGGFAIVLNTKEMETILEKEFASYMYGSISMSDVIYSHDIARFKSELGQDLETIIKHAEHIINNLISGEQYIKFEKNSYSAFLNCIARYKHQGFKEENEVRIFSHLLLEPFKAYETEGKVEKEVLFRGNELLKTPYISLFGNKDSQLPIKEIIVGPQREQDKRCSFIKTLLRNEDIEVTKSEIPYID